jgi:hypothetical protein
VIRHAEARDLVQRNVTALAKTLAESAFGSARTEPSASPMLPAQRHIKHKNDQRR